MLILNIIKKIGGNMDLPIFWLLLFLVIVLLIKIYFYKNSFKKLNLILKKNTKKLESREKKIIELENEIKKKLKKARTIHQRMLPDQLIEPPGYFISDYYQPAEYIGGDYYNFFKIEHDLLDPFFDQYLLYMFDVSGHGIDSTLLSIFINESIENYFKLRHSPGEKISTAELLNYIDLQYQKENFPDDYLVCLFIGVLDQKKHILEYSSAGFQFPIYLFKSDSSLEEVDIGGLPISSALGAMTENRIKKTITFSKNTTMMLSTDGLFEQSNGSEVYHNKLIKLLKNYNFLPVSFLKDLICNDFYKFTKGMSAADDLTFLLLERPESKIISFDFESNSKNKNEAEIIEFLCKNVDSEAVCLDKFIEILKKIFKTETLANKIKVRTFINQDLIMLSIEKSGISTWEFELNNHSELLSITDLLKTKEISKINQKQKLFKNDKVYFSQKNSNSKLYLMLIKNNK